MFPHVPARSREGSTALLLLALQIGGQRDHEQVAQVAPLAHGLDLPVRAETKTFSPPLPPTPGVVPVDLPRMTDDVTRTSSSTVLQPVDSCEERPGGHIYCQKTLEKSHFLTGADERKNCGSLPASRAGVSRNLRRLDSGPWGLHKARSSAFSPLSNIGRRARIGAHVGHGYSAEADAARANRQQIMTSTRPSKRTRFTSLP
jgi:hypothetical protein